MQVWVRENNIVVDLTSQVLKVLSLFYLFYENLDPISSYILTIRDLHTLRFLVLYYQSIKRSVYFENIPVIKIMRARSVCLSVCVCSIESAKNDRAYDYARCIRLKWNCARMYRAAMPALFRSEMRSFRERNAVNYTSQAWGVTAGDNQRCSLVRLPACWTQRSGNAHRESGIIGTALNWFRSYLSSRCFRVKCNNNLSSLHTYLLWCPPRLSCWPSTLCHVYNPAQYSHLIYVLKSPLVCWRHTTLPFLPSIRIPLYYHSLAKCSTADLFLDDCKPSDSQLF